MHVCQQVHSVIVKSGFEHHNYAVNSFIDACGKCGIVEEAARIFKECPVIDLVASTHMITAYGQYGQCEEVLKLYLEMQDRGIKPDSMPAQIYQHMNKENKYMFTSRWQLSCQHARQM
ncbi:hypothetical protein SLE2022_011570 [Rubroshorea leprosula]